MGTSTYIAFGVYSPPAGPGTLGALLWHTRIDLGTQYGTPLEEAYLVHRADPTQPRGCLYWEDGNSSTEAVQDIDCVLYDGPVLLGLLQSTARYLADKEQREHLIGHSRRLAEVRAVANLLEVKLHAQGAERVKGLVWRK